METLADTIFVLCWITAMVTWFVGAHATFMTIKNLDPGSRWAAFLDPTYFWTPANLKLESAPQHPYNRWKRRATRAMYTFIAMIALGFLSTILKHNA